MHIAVTIQHCTRSWIVAAKCRLGGSHLRNVATLLSLIDTAPLTLKRNVSIFISAMRHVSHDAKRQPAQTCAPEGTRAVPGPVVALFPTSTKTRRAGAVSACPRGPAERAAGARRLGDAPPFRPPSAFAGRHLASTLRLPARLRSSRPPRLRAGRRLWRTRAT